MNKEEIANMTGENAYRRNTRLDLSFVKFNGQDGTFSKSKLVNKEWEREDMTAPISGTIIRIRRQLAKSGKKDRYYTNEHNTKNDSVLLFHKTAGGIQKIDSGTASVLREKHVTLKTEQVLYFILPDGTLTKFIVKGASLGSENKADKNALRFYEYLSSFGKDEHVWEYETICNVVEEESSLGSYYAINFERGVKHDDKKLEQIVESIKTVSASITEQDSYRATKVETQQEDEQPAPKEELQIITEDDMSEKKPIADADLPF